MADAGPEDARARLAAEIARLEREIAEIRQLAAWQRGMLLAATADRAATLRQRRPMAQCPVTPLAPVCWRLTGLFHPERTASGGEERTER